MEALGPRGLGLPGQGAGSLLSAEHPPTCPHEHIHLHPVRPHPCGGDPLLAQAQQLSGQLGWPGLLQHLLLGGWSVPSPELRVPLAPLEGMGAAQRGAHVLSGRWWALPKSLAGAALCPPPQQLQVVGTQNYTSHVRDQVPACRPGKPWNTAPPCGTWGQRGASRPGCPCLCMTPT